MYIQGNVVLSSKVTAKDIAQIITSHYKCVLAQIFAASWIPTLTILIRQYLIATSTSELMQIAIYQHNKEHN